jgi:uncharacterized membrane protein YphA (DoxX/SURF4 family)
MLASLVGRWIPAAVLFIAGASKIKQPDGIQRALEWLGVPTNFVDPAWIALVVGEIGLALWLLIDRAARCRWATVGVLVGMTGVLLSMSLSREAPACGCLGLIQLNMSQGNEHAVGIGRNAVLASGVLWSLGHDSNARVTAP